LEAALEDFPKAGLRVSSSSRWWRSKAWPDMTLPDYLNGVALVETSLGAEETLEALIAIEARFGRRRQLRNGSRTLDLDLIAHGRTICCSPRLTLPHPRAHLRRFVMGPLSEVAPGWIHPGLGISAEHLADAARVGRDARPVDGA